MQSFTATITKEDDESGTTVEYDVTVEDLDLTYCEGLAVVCFGDTLYYTSASTAEAYATLADTTTDRNKALTAVIAAAHDGVVLGSSTALTR